jgi:5-methylcytosine-specific restriction endonuclease McrA
MGLCISKNSNESKVIKPEQKPKYHKKAIPKSLKKLVWDTYIGETIGLSKCLCCNHQKIRQIEFHCGHIKSEVNGGETNIKNLRPICAQCNLSMGTMDMYEYQSRYFKS